MKVIFLGDSISSQQAGIHYYGLQLVKRIVDQYPEHTYCIISTSYIQELSIVQKVVPVNRKIPGHLRWRQLFVLPKIIREMQPDLVIELAHFGPFNLGSQIRRITVVHDLTPILFPEFHPYLSVLMHRLLFPRIIRKADFLIVNSVQTKSDLIELLDVNPESVYVAEPQIEDSLQEEVEEEASAEKYFLTVGTREPRKNQIVILKAFEMFCENHDHGRLVIVGKKGWKNEGFERAYGSSPVRNRIELKGYLDRNSLLRLYRGAFAFIQSSIYEGFGIPMIEAQAFGLPLIVARNPSVPEEVANNSILFDKEAVELHKHMEELYSNSELWTRMSNMSRQAFEQHHAKQLELDGIFRES